ncbi:PDR/VanB family oxidoreductase [Paraburkholderia hospita]|uniref:PDR/VanB family oxidoreductase n=1 Tax=Paraburkholderia hospita TaxID=169430 RepID=UPI0008A77B6F|nr:PDR/VanB family oxidoreductase [Paraburkholderia hospita]SEI20825.1 vanillate O-demethylase ferredoxin subunit [Paraburkholderia hospita]
MIEVVVAKIARAAEGILDIELRRPDGTNLPSFDPGAHVDVHLREGLVRQYSLCNDPIDLTCYRLGVSRSAASRGGSSHIHESLRAGDTLRISEPRSLFALSAQAACHRFIAGGIGITPILSMIRWCERHRLPWQLSYCVRSRAHAAYLDELLALGGDMRLYADDEAAVPHDVSGMLAGVKPAEHVYCCGPGGLMDAVAARARDLRIGADRIHFERFEASADERERSDPQLFTVTLARNGARYTVEPDESILDCLERHGLTPPFSCREGLCRSCETAIVSGKVDHRDYVLSAAEQREGKSLMICVSRATTEDLVIDL